MARILLIDTLNSMYCLYHRKEVKPAYNFICAVRKMIEDYSVDKVVLSTDWGKSVYRAKLHPEYKAPREEKRKQLTTTEKAQLAKFYKEVERLMELGPLFGMETIKGFGVESDDFISAIVNNADLSQHEIMVLSTDTDLHQLIRKGVIQRSYASKMKFGNDYLPTNVWVNRKRYVDMYGIEPWQYAHVKSLTGDTSDNVHGVPGLGNVNALKLIQKYGTLEGVQQNIGNILDEIPKFPKKVIPELESNFAVVEKAFKLINLNHESEAYHEIFSIEDQNNITRVLNSFDKSNQVDEEKVKDFLYEVGAVNRVVEFESFIRPFWGN